MYKHILDYKLTFYAVLTPMRRFVEQEIDYTFHQNPYKDLNWAKHYQRKADNKLSPFKQRHEKSIDIYPDLEKSRDDFEVIWNYKLDVQVCSRLFKWDTREFNDLEYEVERDWNLLKSTQDELLWVDDMRFKESKQTWDKANQEWLTTFNKKLDHRKHKTVEQYEANMKKQLASPDAYRWYGGEEGYRTLHPFVDTSETCEYCIEDAKLREQKRLEEEEQKRLEEEEERVEEEEERVEVVQKVVIPMFQPKHCECCDFTATTQYEWNFHTASKEHNAKLRLKKTYCTTCSIQCKNEADYQVHLQTQKHKKRCGDLPQTFRCECCQYETPIKRNFELHCATKKHKDTEEKNQ